MVAPTCSLNSRGFLIIASLFMVGAAALFGSVKGGRRSPSIIGDPAMITGTCGRVFAFGPPGYGENPLTDADDTFLDFTLDSPVDIIDEDGVKTNATEAQIVILNPRKFPFDRLVNGATHSLEGSFDVATTGHHHLQFLFVTEVTDLR